MNVVENDDDENDNHNPPTMIMMVRMTMPVLPPRRGISLSSSIFRRSLNQPMAMVKGVTAMLILLLLVDVIAVAIASVNDGIFHGVPYQRCIGYYLSSAESGTINSASSINYKSSSSTGSAGTRASLSTLSSTTSFLQHLHDNVACESPSWMTTTTTAQEKKSLRRKSNSSKQQSQSQKGDTSSEDKMHTTASSSLTSFNILILISHFHPRSIDSQLIIAATLLSKGMNVTVVYFGSQTQTQLQQQKLKERESAEDENSDTDPSRILLDDDHDLYHNIPLQIYSLLPQITPLTDDDYNISGNKDIYRESFVYMDAPYDVLLKEEQRRQKAAHRNRDQGTAEDSDNSHSRHSTPTSMKSRNKDDLLSACRHDDYTPIPDQPFNECDIQLAPAVLRFLKRHFATTTSNSSDHQQKVGTGNGNEYFDKVWGHRQQHDDLAPHTDKFDVIIHDGAFLGGLMFSEMIQTPVVAIASYQTLHLALEHDPEWAGPSSPDWSFIYRMYQIWKQRMYSLSLTNAFMKVNKMRRQQSQQQEHYQSAAFTILPRLKSPTDVYLPVAAFLVEAAPKHMIIDQIATATMPKTTGTNKLPLASWDDDDDDDDDDGDDDGMIVKGATTVPSRSLALREISSKIGGVDRIHFTYPIIPPCSPCLETTSSDNNLGMFATQADSQPVIMVSPSTIGSFYSNRLSSPEWTRALMKELVAVRRSLESYDECSWDNLSCTKTGLDKFRIVWLKSLNPKDGGDDHLPSVLPDYVNVVPSISLLDSLVRHPTTVVVLTHCGTETQAVSWLGVDVLCVSRSDRIPSNKEDETVDDDQLGRFGPNIMQSRKNSTQRQIRGLWRHISDTADVGIELLRTIKRRQKLKANLDAPSSKADEHDNSIISSGLHSSMNGMNQIVSIVKAVAAVRRSRSQFKSVNDMNRVTSQAAKKILQTTWTKTLIKDDNIATLLASRTYSDGYAVDDMQPYDTFTVLMSWLVVLAALVYILIRDFSIRRFSKSPKSWSSSSSYYHHRNHSSNSSNDNYLSKKGILTRLPDLDDAWDALIAWYHEQPSLLAGSVSDSFTTSGCAVGTDSGNAFNAVNNGRSSGESGGVGQSPMYNIVGASLSTNQDVVGGSEVGGTGPTVGGSVTGGTEEAGGPRQGPGLQQHHEGRHNYIRRRRKAKPHGHHHHRQAK
jgi:hypothetical protein